MLKRVGYLLLLSFAVLSIYFPASSVAAIRPATFHDLTQPFGMILAHPDTDRRGIKSPQSAGLVEFFDLRAIEQKDNAVVVNTKNGRKIKIQFLSQIGARSLVLDLAGGRWLDVTDCSRRKLIEEKRDEKTPACSYRTYKLEFSCGAFSAKPAVRVTSLEGYSILDDEPNTVVHTRRECRPSNVGQNF